MAKKPSVLDALRAASDAQLLELLRARPDLATPPPGSLAGLAARALTRTSLERALGRLNTFQIQVLEAAAILQHSLPMTATTTARVRDALGGEVEAATIEEAISVLKQRLLITKTTADVRVPTEVFAALGRFPAGFGPSLAETLAQREDLSEKERELWTTRLTSSSEITDLLAQAPKKAREVLDLLTWGPPVGDRGTTGHTSANNSDHSPITWLISRGLLATAGEGHVVLPREIALILRDGRTHREANTQPPPLTTTSPTGFRPALGGAAQFVDSSAGERNLEVLQLANLLCELWQEGVPTLRSGGIGVRELRRTAGLLDLAETEAAFLIELLASAQLLALRDRDSHWVPSREQLVWAQRPAGEQWVQLAVAWLNSPRATWLIGQREKGQIVAPLQPGIDRAWVPNLRHRTLEVLAQSPLGAVPNQPDIYAQLRWHSPRSTPPEGAVAAFLEHAQWLGVLGAGSLTTASRHLLQASRATDLAREDAAFAQAITATDDALPPETTEVLIQADLSIVVPGRAAASLAWLWQVARVEQRGAAQVLRLSEASVRSALENGWTAAELLSKLAEVTHTELPQPVEYLVRDVERQFGRVRVSGAASVINTADAASATEIATDRELFGLGLEQVAPTVLTSSLPVAEVLETLRAHGYAPLGEQSATTPQKEAPRPSARGSLHIGQPVTITWDDAAADRALMAIRAGESQEKSGTSDPLVARQRLKILAEADRAGWITVVDGTGKTQRRLVRVLGTSQGRARLRDIERESELVVQLQRIVAVD